MYPSHPPGVEERRRAAYQPGQDALRRRALLGAAALGLSACAAPNPLPAARKVAAGLRRPAVPADRTIAFQSLLRGQTWPPLSAPDSPWQIGADPPATVDSGAEGIRIRSEPGYTAWAAPRLPLTPLLEAVPGQVEELTWEASIAIAPGQRFFVVCDLRFSGEPGAVLVQATPFDVQVTHDADRPRGGASQSVSRLVGDGRPHFWRLRLDGVRVELRLDGSTVWTLDGVRSLARVAFGETRTDALHGGTLTLRDVVYVRRPG